MGDLRFILLRVLSTCKAPPFLLKKGLTEEEKSLQFSARKGVWGHTLMINLYAAWVGVLAGCIAGAVTGLFFYRDNWLGGYSSWPRRMIRLGHISFFGIAFINLAFALTLGAVNMEAVPAFSSVLFIITAVTMPISGNRIPI